MTGSTSLATRVFAAVKAGETRSGAIARLIGERTDSVRCALKALRDKGILRRTDKWADRLSAPGAVWAMVEGATLPEEPPTLWTPEMTDRMIALWRGGSSYSEVAIALGRGITRNTICGRLTRMGLMRRDAAAVRVRVVRKAVPKAQSRVTNPLGGEGIIRMKARAEREATLAAPQLSDDGSVACIAPRHWMERRFGECAFPVSGLGADTLSCCNRAVVTHRGPHYCAGHAAQMTQIATGAWKVSAMRRMVGRVER